VTLVLPEQRNLQHAQNLALELALKKLHRITDLERQCQKSGARLKLVNNKKVITLDYLGKPRQLTLPEAEISSLSGGEPLSTREELLILHYFIRAEGTARTGRKITYRELPDGANYFPVFYKRAISPLVDSFGQQPQRIMDAAGKLGGQMADFGDVAVTVNAFSRVPITLVLWGGDDELRPEGSILFDASISGYLSAEDVSVLCETIAWKLVRAKQGEARS
jgi:hypothetical protein